MLSLLCSNAQASLVRRREAECDASLPLPAAAYVLGGLGLLFGLVALMLLARGFGRAGGSVLFATSIAAVVFELLVLITAIQAQSPSSVCGFPPPPGG